MERPLNGGGEQNPENPRQVLGDLDHIRHGLEAAERDGRPIDHATARRIAAQLHGGQSSPLYSLASCGAIRETTEDEDDTGVGVRSLADELAECRRFFGDDIESWVQAIEAYAASRDDPGPIDNWAEPTGDEFGDIEGRFPWLEWQYLVGAKEPKGSVAHAYRRPRDWETLCGAERSIVGASTYPRIRIDADGTHLLDVRCGDCVIEARRRWSEEVPDSATAADGGQTEAQTGERVRVVTPRIYVASLSDYNNGNLHGRWIDADQDPEELAAEVQAMLRQSHEPVAEDWAIHDYEGFGAFQVGEYESLEVVSAVALGIAECGQAFAAYASWAGASEEALRRFDDCFLGYWPSLAEYARDFGADLGWEAELEKLPEGMRPYVEVDYQQLARDLDSELTTVEGGGGMYVFREP